MDSFLCPIRYHSLKCPSSPAVISGPVSVTYRELDALVTQYEKKLRAKDVSSGDRVAVLPEATLKTIVQLFAVWRAGGVVCLLNPRLPQKQLADLLRSVNCAWSFSPGLSGPPYLALRLSTRANFVPSENISLDPDIPATMMTTSGSTAIPKIVVHSLSNHYQSASAANTNMPLQKGDAWLLSLPLYHVSGLSIVFRTFLAGGSVLLNNGRQPLAQILQDYPVTHISLVSTQLFRLLEQKQEKHLQRLKYILLGGSTIPDHLIQKSRKMKLPIYLTYGLTETASQIATTAHYPPEKSMPGVRIMGNTTVKIHKDGEILVKGPTVCLGYWEGKRIQPAIDDQGWLHTGDLGALKDGELTVFGRKDNMFISGGENIYPEEIERGLLEIDGIQQALVVPVASKEFGHRPAAFIKTAKAIPADQIRKDLAKDLPKFKIPDTFFAWPSDIEEKGIKVHRRDFAELLRKKKVRKIH